MRRAMLACLVAGAVAGFAGYTAHRRLSPAPTPLEVVRIERSLPRSDRVNTDDAGALAMTADGRALVVAVREGTTPSLLLQYLDKFEATAIPSTSGSSMPFVSPDGTVIGFTAVDGSLKSLSAGGDAAESLPPVRAHTRGATIGPAGQLIVGVADGGLLRRTADGTWSALTVPAGGERAHMWPHWIPGEDEIVFTIEYAPPKPSAIGITRVSSPGAHTAVTAGRRAWFVDATHLLLARGDGLWVAERGKAGAIGRESKIDADVARAADGTPLAAVGGGHLVYVPAASGDSLVGGHLDGKGAFRYLLTTRGAFSQPKLSPDGRSVAVTELADASHPSLAVYDIGTGTRTVSTAMTTAAPGRWTDDSRWVLFPQPAGHGWRLAWLARDYRDGTGSVLTESESHDAARGATIVRLRTPGVAAEWLITTGNGDACVKVVESDGARTRRPAFSLSDGVVEGPCGNPNYDVSPDGSQAVAVYHDRVTSPSKLRYVLNFAAELRKP